MYHIYICNMYHICIYIILYTLYSIYIYVYDIMNMYIYIYHEYKHLYDTRTDLRPRSGSRGKS